PPQRGLSAAVGEGEDTGNGFGGFANDQRPTTDDVLADNRAIHKNHSLLEGVVSGIASYGNCFGVPNLGGETKFDACYNGNPLVNAFALGIMRRDRMFLAKARGEGNPVIYVAGAM